MPAQKNTELQIRFFNRIKDLIPDAMSMVDELSEVLGVSMDSVYRRMRGETALTIDEVNMLCNHFKISFDIFREDTPEVTFNYNLVNDAETFRNYIESIRNDMISINKYENKQIMYAANDIPIFHYFNYPELTAFKMFYWGKSIANMEIYANKTFDVSIVKPEFAQVGRQICELYNTIPSVEIWSNSTIDSFLRQVEFYWESGLFKSKEDAVIICNQAHEIIQRIANHAETGTKNMYPVAGSEQNKFMLYVCDLEFGGNHILVQRGEFKTTYINIHSFNKMYTQNTKFGTETQKWMENLIRKSSLLSLAGEKLRYQFFKQNYDKINRVINKLNT